MKKGSPFFVVIGFVLILTLLAACAPAATVQAPTAAEQPTTAQSNEAPATAVPAPTEAMQAQDVVTWYEYDQNNTDPKADEHVGNAYLAATIPLFNEAFAGKWNWVNVPKAFDKKDAELIAAVQAGGEVPDVYEVASGVTTFANNGTLQDLTDWAKAQSWYNDLNGSALSICTGPDGKLYCIPFTERPQVVYVWKDRFPNGYPTSPDDFLAQAEALKADGFYALSYFGSTDNGGDGITRGMDTILQSFGGGVDDGAGNMLLNTPENTAAITFMRELVAKGYIPEIAYAGGFQEEEAFKDSSAGSFPTGLDGYIYLNPLTAPNGTAYDKGNQNDFLDAVSAGDIYLSSFFSAVEGQKPGCNISGTGLGIPVGAQNIEGAYDYINWLMTPEQNPNFVAGLGGFPALKTSESDALFQSPYYQQAAEVIDASSCHPWYGTLTDPAVAKPMVMNVLYKLIKEDPTADIAAELTAVENEYNAGN